MKPILSSQVALGVPFTRIGDRIRTSRLHNPNGTAMPNRILRLRDPANRRLPWVRYWTERAGTDLEFGGYLTEPSPLSPSSGAIHTLEPH